MHHRIQKMLCAVLVALILLSTFTPAMAASATAKVSSSSAKIYRSASTSSDHAKISKGTKVTVKAVKGNWAKVKVWGKTGYMPVKYLSATSKSSTKATAKSASVKSVTSVKKAKMYTSRKTYVYQKASSSSRHVSVSKNTALYVVGKSGSYYKVQNKSGSRTGYVKASCLSKNKVVTAKSIKKSSTSWKSKVVKMSWFDGGNNVLKKGGYGYIYDIDTGVELRIKRMGGHYHADVEPASAADTVKLLRVANGNYSWKSHAVILKASGKYVACGINTLPHGSQTIRNNNYEGQFCLHMCGSLTHASGKENSGHQASIDRAYEWAHK